MGLTVWQFWRGFTKVRFLCGSLVYDRSGWKEEGIPIEQRDERGVVCAGGKMVALPEIDAYNPVFDVTPA